MGRKVRVNITVDHDKLEKAKSKLHLFGGKLSTLFNAYLDDFVESMDKNYATNQKALVDKINELERKIDRIEARIK